MNVSEAGVKRAVPSCLKVSVMGGITSPSKKIWWSLSHQDLRMWLSLETGSLWVGLVKMRSHWSQGAPNAIRKVSLVRRIYEERCRENSTCRWGQRLDRCIHKPRSTKGGPPSPRERGVGQPPPQNASKGLTLLTPWLQTSVLQSCEKISFCCFKPPSLWYFVFVFVFCFAAAGN